MPYQPGWADSRPTRESVDAYEVPDPAKMLLSTGRGLVNIVNDKIRVLNFTSKEYLIRSTIH